MNVQTLNRKQIVDLILAVGDKCTVIIEGPMGSGKTSIYQELRRHPKFANHVSLPQPVECTQLSDGSLWMPDIDRELGVSRELPNSRFGVNEHNQHGVNGARPVLLMFDEIVKAPRYIQYQLANPIYERRLGEYHFPEGSVVFAATNMAEEGLGDAFQAHLRNRVIIVRMSSPTATEWIQWASDNNVHPVVIAAVHLKPNVMHNFTDYDEGGKYAGLDIRDNPAIFNPRESQRGFATARSLVTASTVLHSWQQGQAFDDVTLECALAGAVGEYFAAHIMTTLRFSLSVTPFERVVADPQNAPVSDNLTAQIVQCINFISQTETREHAEAVVVYVKRMHAEAFTLFGSLVANSRGVALSKFLQTKEFGTLLSDNAKFFS